MLDAVLISRTIVVRIRRNVAVLCVWIRLAHLRCWHLEVKKTKGKQGKAQKEYQVMVEALGHRYLIVRSLGEVVELFEER